MEINKKKILFWVMIFLLLIAIIYFYTYYFAKANEKVIYQKGNRRIYLIDKKVYKQGREMWRMVLEDQQTGSRTFILGNSQKGFKNKEMADLIINTVDQGKMKSYDLVKGAGVTLRPAKTDIHSNTIGKKGFMEAKDDFAGMEFDLFQMESKK